MLVYRIESKKFGWGPYCRYWSDESRSVKLVVPDLASDRNPTPWTDGIKKTGLYNNETYRHGFIDTKKLRAWFVGKERRALKKAGYVCNVYRIPKKHVLEGKKQVVFPVKEAKFVKKSRVL